MSESFAHDCWPSAASAIGKKIAQDPSAGWREVVGVVGDISDAGPLKDTQTIVYWPLASKGLLGVENGVERSLVCAARTTGAGIPGLGAAVRRAVRSITTGSLWRPWDLGGNPP